MTQANDQPQPASAAPVEQELGLEPERAAFEAWATDQGLALNRHRHSYAATATAWCWDAWQGGRAAERERWRRIAVAAQAVTTGGEDWIDYFEVPPHLIAALALALDEGPNVRAKLPAAG